MTKNEIIFTVLEKLSIFSDDTKITEDLVSSLIDTKRAMLLKQQYSSKAWHMPIECKQELCLGLELTEKISGYGCAGKILGTTVALPRSVKIKGKEGPLNIRKEDNTEIAINLVPIERVPYLFQNRYTQHLTYAAVDFNGKLYLISNDVKHKFLKNIKVVDVFESPDKAREYVCGADLTIDAWEDDYPVEAAMVDTIVDLVVKELTQKLRMPEDDINDATDEREDIPRQQYAKRGR